MARKPKIIVPKRGEIYLVNFDPTIGFEIQKTRPALIVQNNVANQHSPITIVAAITFKSENDSSIFKRSNY
ncbi:MAG: type II toxin-antitoxin system PemK/MazF family toxin [Xenococcaceae cyanobacterium]